MSLAFPFCSIAGLLEQRLDDAFFMNRKPSLLIYIPDFGGLLKERLIRREVALLINWNESMRWLIQRYNALRKRS
jgi:hypothetical protein